MSASKTKKPVSISKAQYSRVRYERDVARAESAVWRSNSETLLRAWDTRRFGTHMLGEQMGFLRETLSYSGAGGELVAEVERLRAEVAGLRTVELDEEVAAALDSQAAKHQAALFVLRETCAQRAWDLAESGEVSIDQIRDAIRQIPLQGHENGETT